MERYVLLRPNARAGIAFTAIAVPPPRTAATGCATPERPVLYVRVTAMHAKNLKVWMVHPVTWPASVKITTACIVFADPLLITVATNTATTARAALHALATAAHVVQLAGISIKVRQSAF